MPLFYKASIAHGGSQRPKEYGGAIQYAERPHMVN
jgi:hypothetical protein